MARTPTITPEEFVRKWQASSLKERSAAQEHFIDLCRLIGVPTPAEADPTGESYSFEKGAEKIDGSDGYADVWRRGHFAWEYKGKRKSLDEAYSQLLQYRESLENPPCLVVCDTSEIRVHTNFTGTAKVVHTIGLADLVREGPRKILDAVFCEPERLKPGLTVEQVTEEAAGEFGALAERLRSRGVDPQVGAHFLNKILFCLFAEDVNLLPRGLFQKLIGASEKDPNVFRGMLEDLFRKMAKGGLFGLDRIHHFNGGLFNDDTVVELRRDEIGILERLSKLDWGQIEPAIFGTLFERGLDPSKRSQIGAHYTDRASILTLIEPVLMVPLRREWAMVRDKVNALFAKEHDAREAAVATAKGVTREDRKAHRVTASEAEAAAARKRADDARRKARAEGRKLVDQFRRAYLDGIRVLDPACGSGNFLYVALERLHDLEKEVMLLLAEIEGGQFHLDVRIGPHVVSGIEINPYAHELAQVTIWIGHLQWMIRNGFSFDTNPVLKPIQTIDCRDAIVDRTDPAHPREAEWPKADVVIGNPPFLGGKRLRTELGDDYVDAMFEVYDGRVPREADLVAYWFEKARAAIESKQLRRAGLLATQGIRGKASRGVLDRIVTSGGIFMAWSDEPWVVEGADVRVSFVCFDDGTERSIHLDGAPVAVIHADLSGSASGSRSIDLTKARRLKENLGIAFMGVTKGGAFDISSDRAREWLALPRNPNGRPNSDVVKPWVNGLDITRRSRGMFIIDFGTEMAERDASRYEAPFEHVRAYVKPERDKNSRATYRGRWWIHVEPRPAMRRLLAELDRFVVTPRVAKHRTFTWVARGVVPDCRLFVFATADDFVFGMLSSRFHEVWSLRMCSWHGVGNDPTYNATTCFETFPFPQPSATQRNGIAAAAKGLDRLRTAWLDPEGATSAELKKRTLTGLYNDRPMWLQHAHAELDAAVAVAYGWPADLPEDEVLARLLALNMEREPA